MWSATLVRLTMLRMHMSKDFIAKYGGRNLAICTLVWLVAMAIGFDIPCVYCGSSNESKLVGSSPLGRGFQVSPSQISIRWAKFRPFVSSPQGNFCLGFQEVSNGMDRGYVLCIMYTIRVTDSGSATANSNSDVKLEDEPFSMEMVWSANHDASVGSDSIFSIDEEGYMALVGSEEGSGMATVWSAAESGAGAVAGKALSLEENGNLVFYSGTSSNGSGDIAWQSFEHPTDTILSGQNFTASMVLTVAVPRLLTSGNASFNLEMESDGMALYVIGVGRNASDRAVYWKLQADEATSLIDPSGAPIYARIEAMGYLAMYQTEGSRVSYQVLNTYNSTGISRRRMTLDSDGNVRVYYWAYPSWAVDYEGISALCDLPAPCGPYGICNASNASNLCECPPPLMSVNGSDATQGCALLKEEDNNDGKRGHSNASADVCVSKNGSSQAYAGVVAVRNLFQKEELMNAGLSRGSRSTSAAECEAECEADCQCIAYFFSNTSAIPCSLAYGSVLAMQGSSKDGDLAFLKMAKLPVRSPSSSSVPATERSHPARSHLVQIIVPILGFLAALAAALLLASCLWQRRKPRSIPLEEQSVLRTPPPPL